MVVLEPPQTFSVDDNPWWMGLLVVFLVGAWLFFSMGKGERGRSRGKFAFGE